LVLARALGRRLVWIGEGIGLARLVAGALAEHVPKTQHEKGRNGSEEKDVHVMETAAHRRRSDSFEAHPALDSPRLAAKVVPNARDWPPAIQLASGFLRPQDIRSTARKGKDGAGAYRSVVDRPGHRDRGVH